jgi:hypothetical protein
MHRIRPAWKERVIRFARKTEPVRSTATPLLCSLLLKWRGVPEEVIAVPLSGPLCLRPRRFHTIVFDALPTLINGNRPAAAALLALSPVASTLSSRGTTSSPAVSLSPRLLIRPNSESSSLAITPYRFDIGFRDPRGVSGAVLRLASLTGGRTLDDVQLLEVESHRFLTYRGPRQKSGLHR